MKLCSPRIAPRRSLASAASKEGKRFAQFGPCVRGTGLPANGHRLPALGGTHGDLAGIDHQGISSKPAGLSTSAEF